MTDKVSQLSNLKLYLMLCLPLCIHLLTGLQISTKMFANVIQKNTTTNLKFSHHWRESGQLCVHIQFVSYNLVGMGKEHSGSHDVCPALSKCFKKRMCL